MVDSFLGEEPDFIEGFRDELLLTPVDIPVIILSLLIPPGLHGLWDAVTEEGLEFNVRTEWPKMY